MTVDAGKLRGALTVKVNMKGLRPTKGRLWLMIKLVELARLIGGCRFEVATSWDEDTMKDALVVR